MLKTKMTDSPSLSYDSTTETPTLLYTWSLDVVPLSGVASQQGAILGSTATLEKW